MEHSSDDRFKKQLDDHYEWPSTYLFKFIVPSGQKDNIVSIFPEGHPIYQRESKEGKYVSISAEIMMNSSEDVMDIYRKAYQVKGVISL